MTFLAHWKIEEGRGAGPNGQTAYDSAAGGSGDHNGVYKLDTGYSGVLASPGVGGVHLQPVNLFDHGYIYNFNNIADLRLTGVMTLMFWFRKPEGYAVVNGCVIADCGGNAETQAANRLWMVDTRDGRLIRMLWENGAGVDVSVISTAIMPVRGRFVHVAVVRYEISPGFYGVRFYIDGSLADTQDNGGPGYAGPDGGSSSILYIGRYENGQPARVYCVDSVRVYDSDEGASVAGIYAAELPVFDVDAYVVGSTVNRDGRGNIVQDKVDSQITITLDERAPMPHVPKYSGPRLLALGNRNAGFHK